MDIHVAKLNVIKKDSPKSSSCLAGIPTIPSHGSNFIWLVVYLPLWKIWLRQLGWLFQKYGKIRNVPNHQPVIICLPTLLGMTPWDCNRFWPRTTRIVALINPGESDDQTLDFMRNKSIEKHSEKNQGLLTKKRGLIMDNTHKCLEEKAEKKKAVDQQWMELNQPQITHVPWQAIEMEGKLYSEGDIYIHLPSGYLT